MQQGMALDGANTSSPKDDNLKNASDYRSVPELHNMVSNVKNSTTTFSNIVKTSAYPKKEQAVIFPAFDSLQVKDYVIAAAEVVNPDDIRFVSRMSNNRICLYFSTKDVADKFIDEHAGVNINNVFIPARKLMMPAKRIIISNIPPFIPDHIVEDRLHSLNIRILSPISYIGAGIGIEKLKHVLSFRRQVFISPDNEFPSSVLIKFGEEEFRIFLSDEKITCFRCKAVGHIASKCTNKPFHTEVTAEDMPTSNKRPHSKVETGSSISNNEPDAHISDEEHDNAVAATPSVDSSPHTENKEKMELEIEICDKSIEPKTNSIPKAHRQVKKIRTEPPTPPDNYEDIEKLWESENSFALDFCHFTDFLNSVKGSDRPLEIALRYTENIDGLIQQINTVRRDFSQRHLKERCKRLITALRKAKDTSSPSSSPQISRCSSQLSITESKSSESINSLASCF